MTLDANILIAYLSGEGAVVATLSRWKQQGEALFLPTVVEAEVLSFSKFTATERRTTERFLEEHFISVSCDRSVARAAAQLRASFRIRLPDSIIAATALLTHTPLVTRNVRDFRNVPELSIVEL